MIPVLYVLRGLPGSGKTTLAKKLRDSMPVGKATAIAADDYFYDAEGNYEFDPRALSHAHADCMARVKNAMALGVPNIFLHNTSTREREIAPYHALANEMGYAFVSLIVENRHEGQSVHDVPEHTLKAMRDRFSIRL